MKSKKSPRTVLKRHLDRLIQQIYVKKYPKCLVSDDPTDVMHHFVPKSRSLYLRYDVRNLIPLCKSCHAKHHWGDPKIHAIILKKKGWDWYENLNKDRQKVMKNTMGNLREIKERLTNENRKSISS